MTEFVDRVVRRSQRSIAVDVKDARGAEAGAHPCHRADAFVDVFRPGALERIGLGPDDLLARNARLIYARMTGYGQEGPMAPMAGHDINYLAMSGALHAIGRRTRRCHHSTWSATTAAGGMLLAVGLLSGILEARQSGKGQVVDVAMVDGVVTMMTRSTASWPKARWEDRRCANVLDGAATTTAPTRPPMAAHIAVGAMEPRFYDELDPQDGGRRAQGDSAETWAAHAEVMAERFREKTRAEWEREIVDPQDLRDAGPELERGPTAPAPSGPGTFVEIDGVVQPSPSPRYSRTKAGRGRTSVAGGAHRRRLGRDRGRSGRVGGRGPSARIG